jgi:hypothetical protein
VPTVLKSGSFNLLEPSGPVQACNAIALPWFTKRTKGTVIQVKTCTAGGHLSDNYINYTKADRLKLTLCSPWRREQRYNPTYSWPGHYMEGSSQLHNPTILFPTEEPPVPFGQEAGMSLQPIWMFWRIAKLYSCYRESKCDFSVVTIRTELSRLPRTYEELWG